MKTTIRIFTLSFLLLSTVSFACRTCGCSAKSSKSKVESSTKTSDVTSKSKVKWVGEKVTGSHEGLIDIFDAYLEFNDDNKLVGGEVTINMNTINCTDLEGDAKNSIEGHLKSDDFFSVKKHPTSTLIIKKAKYLFNNNYEIVADLTIKGITNEIKFKTKLNDNIASADIVVDRTTFDIRYGSGSFFDNLGDKMIYDDFKLSVSLNY